MDKSPLLLEFTRIFLQSNMIDRRLLESEKEQWEAHKNESEYDEILLIWLRLQEDEIREMAETLGEVLKSIQGAKRTVKKRVESEAYLQIVRRVLRNWAAGESEVKRKMLRNLLINAAVRKTAPDYAISMFTDWIDRYSEEHFAVMRKIEEEPNITRHDIWESMHGRIPPEDSAEADMYKLLILDLSTGHIIRQKREKDYYGNFMRASSTKPRKNKPLESSQVQSAFDNERGYVLTELGKQFLHYIIDPTL